MSSPQNASQAALKRRRLRLKRKSKIEILGLSIPAKPWVVTCFSCILILGAFGSLALKVVLPVVDREAEKARVEKEALQKADLRRHEYEKHLYDASQQKIVDKPDLTVSFFQSDGCILVRRKGSGSNDAMIDNWIPASSIPIEQPPKLASAGSQLLDLSSGIESSAQGYQLGSITVDATEKVAEPQGCTGKCLDPHPGPFQSWNGQQNGCWIQVWRRWPEGCTHYQWYNTCNGYWDSYPNGAPKVYWTCCMH